MPLTFRNARGKKDHAYIEELARREINIRPKRIKKHHNVLAYNEGRRIGFISFRVKNHNNVYIYMLALEKHAQNKGYAREILQHMMNHTLKKQSVNKVTARMKKGNVQGLHAAEKYGYTIVKERPRYFEIQKNYK